MPVLTTLNLDGGERQCFVPVCETPPEYILVTLAQEEGSMALYAANSEVAGPLNYVIKDDSSRENKRMVLGPINPDARPGVTVSGIAAYNRASLRISASMFREEVDILKVTLNLDKVCVNLHPHVLKYL